MRIIAQSQFDVNQENRERSDFVAQAREADWSSVVRCVALFQRVKIDVLVETFLGFNNFRACQSHEAGTNMRYSYREICPRLVQRRFGIGGRNTKVGRENFEGRLSVRGHSRADNVAQREYDPVG